MTDAAILTTDGLHTLRHMLGLDDSRRDSLVPYRNYAAAGHDEPAYLELAAAGFVERYRRCDHYDWWRCTPAGIAAATDSARARQWPAGKRRYRRYLKLRDVMPDLTFRQFLWLDAGSQS